MSVDPAVREGIRAVVRTVINILISIADLFPGFGEALSWAADIGKIWKVTDLTPDVSKTIAWGTEIFEFVSWGVVPSHFIETILQFSYDLPRITSGVKAWTRQRQA